MGRSKYLKFAYEHLVQELQREHTYRRQRKYQRGKVLKLNPRIKGHPSLSALMKLFLPTLTCE